MKNILLTVSLFLSIAGSIAAQNSFEYSAQKSLIPKDLGKVYLGMTLKDFALELPMARAEVVSMRFDWLELKVPVNGKAVDSVRLRVHGLSQQEKAEMIVSESSSDESESEVDRILVSRIPPHGFVYSMYVTFKPDFDLKSYVLKTYGNGGEVRKDGDEYHFYDIQWTKKTSDGLDWLIRSFHLGDSRELQLLGRIAETEWDDS